jgi:hypothetical protein
MQYVQLTPHERQLAPVLLHKPSQFLCQRGY